MMDISVADWAKVEALAGRSGLPAERVSILRRRAEAAHRRLNGAGRAGGVVLLVGRPDAGIELLLGKWLGPQAVAALDAAGDGPVLVGSDLDALKEKLGDRPAVVVVGKPARVVALRAHERVPGHVAAVGGAWGTSTARS